MNIKNSIKTLCLLAAGMLVISGYNYRGTEQTGSIKCTLKGEVIDRPQSSQLMLVKEGEDARNVNWISIPIVDGKFEYVLECEYEELYKLIFHDEWSRGAWRTVQFISEQGTVNFTLHHDDKFDMNRVEGGKLNREYLDYISEFVDNAEENDPFKFVLAKFEEITGSKFISTDTHNLFNQTCREDLHYQEWLLWNLKYAREHPTVVGYGILISVTRDRLETINDFASYADVFQTVFAPKYPNHPYTAKMTDLLTGSSLKAGAPFIDFTAVDFTGKQVKLSEQIAGKPAVLHLWASWCGPCRGKGKELIPVYEEFRNKGFVVIGVARERNMSSAEAAVKADKYPWENLVEINDAEQIWVKYGIGNAAGSDFLIDKNGTVVAVNPSVEEIRNFLNK
jgi:thiol-disulfide isomerase/thioredoxin